MTASAKVRSGPAPPRTSEGWQWASLFVHLVIIFALCSLGLRAWWHVGLWALYGLVLLVLFTRGVTRLEPEFGGSLLGPVFFYDLVRTSRQGRHIVLRCAYAGLLLCVLFAICASRFAGQVEPFDLFATVSVSARELPDFAATFFSGFLCTQLAVVFLVTPVYTAGAIAEERERRTLEFLLTTHLTAREIIFGKLASRLGNLALLLLAGLPILGIMQVMGGVDPSLVLAGFAATAVTMLSVGSVGILMSALTRKPLVAVVRTYVFLVVALSVGACIPILNFGHPVVAVTRLRMGWLVSGATDPVWEVTLAYVLAHLLYTAVCLVVAVTQLRPAALRVAEPQPIEDPYRPHPAAPPEPSLPARHRPPIGDDALLWKEMHVDQEFRWERAHPVVAVLLLFVAVCTAAVGITIVVVGLAAGVSVMGPMHVWVQVVGTTLLGLICLLVGFYAAGSVSRERERQTLDNLLTVPESVDGILHAKWLGSLLSVRQIYPLLCLVYGLGLLTGGLSPLSLPLVLVAAVSYPVFVAGLGLYCSVACGSTMRATLYTLVAVLAVSGAAWLLAENRHELLATQLPPPVAAGLAMFLRDGLAPPMPLLVLSFPLTSSSGLDEPPTLLRGGMALGGVLCYLTAGLVLRHLAARRMRAAMR